MPCEDGATEWGSDETKPASAMCKRRPGLGFCQVGRTPDRVRLYTHIPIHSGDAKTCKTLVGQRFNPVSSRASHNLGELQ